MKSSILLTAVHRVLLCNPPRHQDAVLVFSQCRRCTVTVLPLQVFEHPETVLTWAAEFPDAVKFRKGLDVWPLRFALEAIYHKAARRFSYGCSCQVNLARPQGRHHGYAPDSWQHACIAISCEQQPCLASRSAAAHARCPDAPSRLHCEGRSSHQGMH